MVAPVLVVARLMVLPVRVMVGCAMGPYAVMVAVAVFWVAPSAVAVTVSVAVRSEGLCEVCVTVELLPEAGMRVRLLAASPLRLHVRVTSGEDTSLVEN